MPKNSPLMCSSNIHQFEFSPLVHRGTLQIKVALFANSIQVMKKIIATVLSLLAFRPVAAAASERPERAERNDVRTERPERDGTRSERLERPERPDF